MERQRVKQLDCLLVQGWAEVLVQELGLELEQELVQELEQELERV